jgi:hypothetical protein
MQCVFYLIQIPNVLPDLCLHLDCKGQYGTEKKSVTIIEAKGSRRRNLRQSTSEVD